MKKRVFSGTRATGRLHLGNYLGAVKGYIALQNDPNYECVYMAVDLHTITTPFDKKTLSESTKNIILDYLAAGLDPKKAIITKQSLVPEHTYLSFIFSSVLTVGRMEDLPTYKDKVRQHPGNVTMALLNYPVLMASDILAYKASLVPCGVDQEPHLEVTREVARKMNDLYGTDFPQVQRFVTEGESIPSLLGEGKMSKSVEGSYINLSDKLEVISDKLAGVPTDIGRGHIEKNKGVKLYIPENAPIGGQVVSVNPSGGVGTLMKLVELFIGKEKREEYEKMYQGSGMKYRNLKEELAEAIYGELKPIQEKRAEIENTRGYVDRVILEGAERARKIAGETLREVREKMGLI
jgi:tryptophanyl-tRNA synthetase